MRKILIVAAICLAAGAGIAYAGRQRLSQFASDITKPAVPPAIPASEFATSTAAVGKANVNSRTANVNVGKAVLANKPANVNVNASQSTAGDFNLAVPFTTQAPFANWVDPYEDACEEASSAMVAYFYDGKKFASPAAADAELKRVFAWEEQAYGSNKDTTAEQTARILRELYGFKKVRVLADPTAETIRVELRAGHPVIVPAYGKALNNPNFKNGGPTYHMLVVKGYIGDKIFVTNDPGTRKGADYVYQTSVIMNAMHDWNGGDVSHGSKVAIVAYPN